MVTVEKAMFAGRLNRQRIEWYWCHEISMVLGQWYATGLQSEAAAHRMKVQAIWATVLVSLAVGSAYLETMAMFKRNALAIIGLVPTKQPTRPVMRGE